MPTPKPDNPLGEIGDKLGMRILHIEPGLARVGITVRPDHLHSGGVIEAEVRNPAGKLVLKCLSSSMVLMAAQGQGRGKGYACLLGHATNRLSHLKMTRDATAFATSSCPSSRLACTRAIPVSKSTSAFVTPSISSSACWTRRAQAPQTIPSTWTVCSPLGWPFATRAFGLTKIFRRWMCIAATRALL